MDKVVVERCLYTELPLVWRQVAVGKAITILRDAYVEFVGKEISINGNSDEVAEYLDSHIYWVEEDEFHRQTLCSEGRW